MKMVIISIVCLRNFLGKLKEETIYDKEKKVWRSFKEVVKYLGSVKDINYQYILILSTLIL